MLNNKTFLAVIPARGGSKGIPNKNIVDVHGKPLIQYTIDAALQSKYIDKVVVSTEDEAISNVARKCGAEIPFIRPMELASDNAKTIDTVIHALKTMEQEGSKFDYVVLLQPTQPLRESWHIDESIEKILFSKTDGLVSVSKVNDHPILVRTLNDKDEVSRILEENSTVRRQEFPDYYKVNGAIYINRVNESFTEETSLNDNKLAYVMDGKYDLDIDETLDLELLRLVLGGEINIES
ncbi:acylneuraminate cytidylyltransferase family protein [Bacillus hwajinpoensis]|uniref:Acylneuraminate cytidylyltransferase family protein n=1 Tax=Guptibacillus hwajinpoensis TaxID=208199 RepID=A0A845ER46_9BACL|nr:acylneuraminate cytidylyltransferase family protein [Pseudalkalibacillus hwajinpoensis]MYL62244.1 acylneuraminate cytidylyltransferase family protein [Pseudalkalibacillus hwajinpoensis]